MEPKNTNPGQSQPQKGTPKTQNPTPGGHAPQGGGSQPIPQTPPAGGGHAPQGGGQAPQGGGYPPQGAYPPPGTYPPAGGGNAPQGGGHAPQGGGYAPQGGGYPQQGAYPPPGAYPPYPPYQPQGTYPPGAYQDPYAGYPPQGAYPPAGYPQQQGEGFPPAQGGGTYPPVPPAEDTTPANFQLGTKLPAKLKVTCPKHDLKFDEEYFIRLLAGSISLSKDEKKKIIESIPKLKQAQIDELIRIFEEEKQKFAALSKKHVPQLEKLAQQHFDEWMDLEQEWTNSQKKQEDTSKADAIRKQLGI